MKFNWSIVSKDDVEKLAQTIRRMDEGNLTISVPPTASSLTPVTDALRSLKHNFTQYVHALNEERRTLNVTLNGLTDAVLLFEGTKATFINNAAQTMFGLYDFHTGLTLDELELPSRVNSTITRMFKLDRAVGRELEPDPNGRSLKVTSAPLESHNNRRTTLITISDITKRVLVDQIRTDFVAAASHELKTPVAGIELVSETALLALKDGDTETATGFIQQLQGEASNLRRLVTDLLDLSRFETAVDTHSVADVRHVVHTTLLSHRVTAEAKGLELASDFSALGDEEVFVKGSPTDVTIMLDNLVDNALAYTDSGEVLISVEATFDEVAIEVSDSGIGIPPSEIARIFERFYRVDQSRSRASGGTGLGLALVKHAAERLGGTVEVESVVGDGSRFTVTLPRAH